MSSNPATQARPATGPRIPWLPLVLVACAVLALAGGLLHRGFLSLLSALLLLLAWLPVVWRRHSLAALSVWVGLAALLLVPALLGHAELALMALPVVFLGAASWLDRKSTRLNSSHPSISYAVFCLKKKKTTK